MQTTFHIMAKPIGARCNLACSYCYYLHKENSYVTDPNERKMSENVLRSFIRQYIDHQPGPAISFSWQGGEPTLLGVDYFEHIVELQKLYCPPDKAVANDIQTNGTLLDDRWCEFLRANRFLVGVSVDGPPHIHDHYRLQRNGSGSSDKVVAGIRLMQKHQVEFNTLTVVNRLNAQHPLEVYNYLTGELGSNFLQFIPCVESVDFDHTAPGKLQHERMPRIGEPQARPGNPGSIVTDWSVDPDDYGDFLITIFDHWVRHDVGRIFVRTFDVMLGLWLGMGSSSCDFGEICGKALALEHDGSVYSCDHFVYPQYKLGNLTRTPLKNMVLSERQVNFGFSKLEALPGICRECPVKFACNGECLKNRIIKSADGEPGLNYLCSGLKRFMLHIDPYMQYMAAEYRAGKPVASVMNYTPPLSRGGDPLRRGGETR